MSQTEHLSYYDDEVELEGFIAYPTNKSQAAPLILVAHDWSGCNTFAKHKAEQLAQLGYIGFALDMYGKGKLGTTKDEKVALMQPLASNRQLLQKRIQAGYQAAKKIQGVDTTKIGAIGFCFGGLCVLDLARSGVDIQGVVSFHGLLHAPEHEAMERIQAKILALHGYDDPMVKPEQVISFCDEMTKANVDWQMVMYGNTMHAFMNPEANDATFGTVYHAETEKRAWREMTNFFSDLFS